MAASVWHHPVLLPLHLAVDSELCSQPREQTLQVYPTSLEREQILPRNFGLSQVMKPSMAYQTDLEALQT